MTQAFLFNLQSSSYYPYVTSAHTATPALPLSDYQGILRQLSHSHCPRLL